MLRVNSAARRRRRAVVAAPRRFGGNFWWMPAINGRIRIDPGCGRARLPPVTIVSDFSPVPPVPLPPPFGGVAGVTIDADGRLALPADTARQLRGDADAANVLVVPSFEPDERRCVEIWPEAAWPERLRAVLGEAEAAGRPKLEAVIRFYADAATKCRIDKAGRLNVPGAFRSILAASEDDARGRPVIVAGHGAFIGLYTQAAYDAASRAWRTGAEADAGAARADIDAVLRRQLDRLGIS